mmetsp:Transcript_7657/g.14305  ORF Transcript_7657/g.14305 Transcript_7657/m.14305 type:complete len:238 (+) Transcript_7657:62-775(+)
MCTWVTNTAQLQINIPQRFVESCLSSTSLNLVPANKSLLLRALLVEPLCCNIRLELCTCRLILCKILVGVCGGLFRCQHAGATDFSNDTPHCLAQCCQQLECVETSSSTFIELITLEVAGYKTAFLRSIQFTAHREHCKVHQRRTHISILIVNNCDRNVFASCSPRVVHDEVVWQQVKMAKARVTRRPRWHTLRLNLVDESIGIVQEGQPVEAAYPCILNPAHKVRRNPPHSSRGGA